MSSSPAKYNGREQFREWCNSWESNDGLQHFLAADVQLLANLSTHSHMSKDCLPDVTESWLEVCLGDPVMLTYYLLNQDIQDSGCILISLD